MDTAIKGYVKIGLAFCSILLVSCGSLTTGPSDTSGASVAMNITIPKGQVPDRVTVNINNGTFNEMQESDFNNPEGITFTGLPLGDTWVMVDAFEQNRRTMMGSGQIDIIKGPNTINIKLNTIFSVAAINPSQEEQFEKTDTEKSPFWDSYLGQHGTTLTSGQSNTQVTVCSVLGSTSLFFLAIILDENFTPGPGIPQGEEWLNDVFVVYVSYNSPDMGAFLTSPRFRMQCKIGEENPSDGELEIVSQHMSPQIDKTDKISAWPEIEIKLLDKPANNKRILEVRIPRNYIHFTSSNPPPMGGIVIRYNDQNNQQYTKLDWKGQNLDPDVNEDAWGIMEFQQ